jgi:hypothetical protein
MAWSIACLAAASVSAKPCSSVAVEARQAFHHQRCFASSHTTRAPLAEELWGPHWTMYMRRMCITGEETLMNPFLSTAVIADPFVPYASPERS